MAPYVVSKALGGPLIDRVGSRRISVTADVISAAAVGAVPLLHSVGGLPFPVLLALVGLTGIVRGPGDTAKRVLVPDVADAARVPLERVTGLSGMVDRLADTIGPALAGVIVVGFGPLTALALDAGTFAVSAVVIAATAPRSRPGPSDGEGYLVRLRAGLTFVRGEPLLRIIVIMIAVSNLVDAAVFGVLLPVWAKDTGHGPMALGWLAAAFGATALIGSLTAAAVGHRLPRRAAYLIGFVIVGGPGIAILAVDGPLWMVIAVWAVAGFGGGVINPIVQAIMFERTPRQMLGRVSAVTGSLAWSGIPLGGPLAAGLLALAGLAPTLLVLSAVYVAATTLPGLSRHWHDMDASRAVPPRQRMKEPTAPRPGPDHRVSARIRPP